MNSRVSRTRKKMFYLFFFLNIYDEGFFIYVNVFHMGRRGTAGGERGLFHRNSELQSQQRPTDI